MVSRRQLLGCYILETLAVWMLDSVEEVLAGSGNPDRQLFGTVGVYASGSLAGRGGLTNGSELF